ncbi:hypothetical protein GCM10022199_26150 [Marihabitans asiaticum]|uniref:Mechanosensitive ion channel-like protein n=1 Tax=Marihabitans asiaticum TaxID=415218 RepID=A0A560WGI8_9MICO|nr:mechanosensitive ion channel family protein [Marihabitans asiaticum]TWD16799.1 mechanosensitive ion channel-like protein [Marihabitans asiaticum]
MDDVDLPGGLGTLDPVWAGVLVFVLALLISIAARVALSRYATRGESDRHAVRQIGRLLSITLVLIGSLLALDVAGVRIGPMLGALGVGGIAVAIAAQDILQNFLAGLMIQVRRPFVIGDQIWTNDYEGTVVDVDLRATRLVTYDGLNVIIPNASVLREPIVNNTRTPLRRTTLAVGVRYDTDLELARYTLLTAVREVDGVSDRPSAEAFVEEFADSSINFALMYWHSADMATRWRVRTAVAIAVKKALDEAEIEIPFPQRVIWHGDGPEPEAKGADAAP